MPATWRRQPAPRRWRSIGDDVEAIAAAVAAQVAVPGDVYALERVAGGRHAAVMRYELNSSGLAAGASG